jgi:hypothetical protein
VSSISRAQADVGTSVERPAFDADVNVIGTVRDCDRIVRIVEKSAEPANPYAVLPFLCSPARTEFPLVRRAGRAPWAGPSTAHSVGALQI